MGQHVILKYIRRLVQKLQLRKGWVDWVIALLTIPVLLTIVFSNILTIREKNNIPENSTPQASQQPINIVVENPTIKPSPQVSVTPSVPVCKDGLPTYEIVTPQENALVTGDPVCLVFVAQEDRYCSVRWAFRVNNTNWSPFTSQPVCLYNMKSGPVTVEVKFRAENDDEQIYTRKFTYQDGLSVTPSPTPTTSSTP